MICSVEREIEREREIHYVHSASLAYEDGIVFMDVCDLWQRRPARLKLNRGQLPGLLSCCGLQTTVH